MTVPPEIPPPADHLTGVVPLAPRLTAALERVTVRPDGRRAVVEGRELTAETPRELRGRLTDALYRELHAGNSRPVEDPATAPRRDTRDRALEQRYAAGVPHRWAPASGRLVDARPGEGQLVVRLPEITARVPADRLLGPADPAPGTLVQLAVEAARPALSPGFFYVLGSRALPRPAGPVRRLFTHLTDPGAAVAHWSAVLTALEASGAAYHAKVLSDPEDFPRRDALVVYLHGDDGTVERAVTRAVHGLPGRGTDVSLFTDELAPGLSAAWDPADPRPGHRDLSFGQHRCLTLATALIDHALGGRGGNPAAQVARAFRQAGIDPLRPAHNTTQTRRRTDMTDTAVDTAAGPAGGFGTALTTAYSEALAGVYDDVYPDTPDLDDIGTFLLTLTRPGSSVLELGVGTGRVALRLAAQGFDVHGVETSPAMLARLAGKDPAGTVTPHLGDLVALDLGRTFDVVLAPFNVLCCATTVDEQIALMHALARHTAPGGHVVTETFDPSDHHVQKGNALTTHPVGERGAMIESVSVLPASQNMLVQNTLFLDGAAPSCATTVLRYLWPSELDLLGGIARLELTARHAGWREQPFDGGDSRRMCVSVFRPLA